MKGVSGKLKGSQVFLIFFVISALFHCGREKKGEISYPVGPEASPEEVVRQYQAFVDQNRFDEAKKLCTEREQVRLEEVRRIVMEESQDSTCLNSVFLQMECRILGDSAACMCRIKDQYETYNTSFSLVRRSNRWLVDAPEEEEILFGEEEIKTAIDSFFEQSRKQ